MARPQKFRLSPDDVLEPQNAKKLAGHVSEIELFRKQVDELQKQIAGIYDAADEDGFDKKFVRKAVARRAKDSTELASEEAATDAYAMAVEIGLATRTHEGNPPHDAETGEIIETTEPGNPAGSATTVHSNAPDTPVVASQNEPSGNSGEFNSAPTGPTAVADAQPEPSAVPAEELPDSSAPIQPETAAQTARVHSPVSTSSVEREVVESSASNHPGGDHANSGGKAVASLASRDLPNAAGETTPADQRDARAEGLPEIGRNPEPTLSPPGDAAEGTGGVTHPSLVPALYAAPGEIVMERTPPRGIVAHPYAACWPVNNIDVTGGVREPIVKIEQFILDGRGRYFAARDAGIEYPVVQYDGTDPLLDSIRWNLASRPGRGKWLDIVLHKLCKLVPERADEIEALFGAELERQAAE